MSMSKFLPPAWPAETLPDNARGHYGHEASAWLHGRIQSVLDAPPERVCPHIAAGDNGTLIVSLSATDLAMCSRCAARHLTHDCCDRCSATGPALGLGLAEVSTVLWVEMALCRSCAMREGVVS